MLQWNGIEQNVIWGPAVVGYVTALNLGYHGKMPKDTVQLTNKKMKVQWHLDSWL